MERQITYELQWILIVHAFHYFYIRKLWMVKFFFRIHYLLYLYNFSQFKIKL